ncbi:xanthine dehydrogenase FAD-binding subunit XdhB [Moorella naiadis]|uniref:xanthine dehydrogenase FAD-binding subunit XdhB n=1 Tax=Moorella naiadis (nom. illeg.) TaxID=3093670 RepID=UPI003D9C9712
MYNFEEYFEAATVAEALDLLVDHPDLTVIAGGTDVLIKMHHGQLAKASLLSIRGIQSLQGIQQLEDGTILIGPLTTFTQVINDPVIQGQIPVLAEAAASMGGPQIRNVATIGGNICNGATSADSAPTLLALNARLKLQSRQGERVVPIQEFYLGPGKVDLKPGELLTAITIVPADYQGYGGRYIKFSMRKAMDIATLGVAVLCRLREGNILADVRIGLGVAGPTPRRCPEAEAYARGKAVTPETMKTIGRLAVKSTRARTSWRASKEYREHLVAELTRRALRAAISRAGGEGIA